MTSAEWIAYEARRNRQAPSNSDGVEDEAALHADILAECKRRGWIVFHGSMAHATARTKGEPDFVLLMDGGKTLLIEAKTRKGKLSTDQLGIQAWAKKLDHTIHVVRSMEDFHTVIQGGKS